MESSSLDKAKEKSDKAKVRRWILKAVVDVEGNRGATVRHIEKFLDSKQDETVNKQEWKIILKKLLDSGHLTKREGGRYVVKKLTKIPGKDKKKSTVSKANKKLTKKPKLTAKKV